jgi:hypothetical protein
MIGETIHLVAAAGMTECGLSVADRANDGMIGVHLRVNANCLACTDPIAQFILDRLRGERLNGQWAQRWYEATIAIVDDHLAVHRIARVIKVEQEPCQCLVLRALAWPWSDHAEWRQEWDLDA